MDPSSLVTVPMETSRLDMSPNSTHSHISACHMEDSPQPLSTYPIEPQYGESVCLNVMYSLESVALILLFTHWFHEVEHMYYLQISIQFQ